MIEVKNRLVESLSVLNSIWDDIGLMGEQKEERIDLVFMYIKLVPTMSWPLDVY